MHEPYTDIYFLRSLEILRKEKLNPFVRAQVFIRKGPGKIYGLTEVNEIIKTYSHFFQNGGKLFSLTDGDKYVSEETILVLEGRIQDLITLETMILGVMSAETTKGNDNFIVNGDKITERFGHIVNLISGRSVYYFGARHWRYNQDVTLSKAAYKGGAIATSTAAGAPIFGKPAVGTIPHSLENIYAWKYGKDNAVLEATKAFDRIIDKKVPRIALVDYANKEINDSLKVARYLNKKLTGIRVDTCGENSMQGAQVLNKHTNNPYWYGHGVTISGIYALRQALNKEGFNHVQIILSSGFGDLNKVNTFVKAESELKIRLFDGLGIGSVYDTRIATMDIVGVGESSTSIRPIAKVGRSYKPNKRLREIANTPTMCTQRD